MRSVPIPGEILRNTVFLGLTFDELVTLGSVPLVVVFPSLFIEQIPLMGTLAVIGLSCVGVVAVVIRTPDGQTPLEWAPAAFRRRFTPDTYYLKPRVRNRDTAHHADVVLTADRIRRESVDDVNFDPEAIPDPDPAETGSNAGDTVPDAHVIHRRTTAMDTAPSNPRIDTAARQPAFDPTAGGSGRDDVEVAEPTGGSDD